MSEYTDWSEERATSARADFHSAFFRGPIPVTRNIFLFISEESLENAPSSGVPEPAQ